MSSTDEDKNISPEAALLVISAKKETLLLFIKIGDNLMVIVVLGIKSAKYSGVLTFIS